LWNTALAEPFCDSLTGLRSSIEASFAPDAFEIAHLAREARDRLASRSGLQEVTGAAVLDQLAAADKTASWDELCQRLAALVAVERALRDSGAIDAGTSRAWHARAERIAAELCFASVDRQWPRLFTEQSTSSLADVAGELDALRAELQFAAAGTSPRAGSEVAP
jgi:hypothetical protein